MPIAKTNKAAKKAEAEALKAVKKKYSYADLCTAREHASLNQHLANRPKDPENLNDEYLNAYVDSILSVKINEETFTDEYLSNNIVSLFEYCKNFEKYESMKAAYPDFFENLPEEKKLELKVRADAAEDFSKTITAHMKAHGIVINTYVDGEYKADLLKEKPVKRERDADHKADIKDYEDKRKKFFKENFRNGQRRLMEYLLSNESLKSENALDAVNKKINKKKDLTDEKNVRIQAALAELKKILEVRDRFLLTLSAIHGMTADIKEGNIQKKFDRRIANLNRRIFFATRCADHYREYIDFQLGEKRKLSNAAQRFIDNQQKVRNAVEKQQIEEKVQQQIVASDAFAIYRQASDNLGTNTAFEKVNMTIVKNSLREFKDKLKEPLGNKQKKDFFTLKISVLTSINNLSEACTHYLKKKEADNETNSVRYGYIKTIKEQMAHFKSYYENLSEDRFTQLKQNATNFGQIMERDQNNITVNESEKEFSEDIMRNKDLNDLNVLHKSLETDPYAYGNATTIHKIEKELTAIFKENIPSDEKEFKKTKEKVEGILKRAIIACEQYSDYKTRKPPSFGNGRERLNTVRKMLGIHTRQLDYLSSLDQDAIQSKGKLSQTFGSLFESSTTILSKNELQNRSGAKFVDQNGDVPYEADLLSGMLGVKGIYGKTEKAIVTEGKQNVRKGFLLNETPIQDSSVKKGNKKINGVISFAREQGLDVAYSDAVLKSFSTIRIMDYLTGRENRGDEDLVYNTEVKTVSGRQMVNIQSVKSINDRSSFNKKEMPNPVQMGLVDKNGRFLMPYDTKLADRVLKTSADTMLTYLTKQGARLDNETKEAFKKRYEVLQDLFVKDKANGWRSEFTKNNEKEPEDFDIRNEYSKVDEKNLPVYMKKELVSTMKKYDPISQSENKDISKGDNKWISKNGTIVTEVNYKPTQQDKKAIEELRKTGTKEEKDLKEKIYLKKKKIELIKEYKKSDTRSAYKMKKRKLEFVKLAENDIQLLEDKNSKDYKEILDNIVVYGNIMSTAQYQRQDEHQRILEKIDNESYDEKWKRVFDHKRGREESDALKNVRNKIKNFMAPLEEKIKENKPLTDTEKKEYDKIKAYRDKFDALCMGNLKVPEAKSAPGPEDDLDEYIKRDKEEKKPVLIDEDENSLVYTKYEGNIVDDFVVIVDINKKEEAPLFTSQDILMDTKLKEIDIKGIRGELKEEPYKMRDERDTPLFIHEPCIEDISQGHLGDCYALAALAALVEKRPDFIKNMMKDNGNGTVTVRLYDKNGQEIYVTVKKEVPVNPNGKSDSDDYFAENCLWVQMLEKAYVMSGICEQFNNNWKKGIDEGMMTDEHFEFNALKKKGKRTYSSISGGKPQNFMEVLTGVESKGGTISVTSLSGNEEWFTYLKNNTNKNTGRYDLGGLAGLFSKVEEEISEAEKNPNVMIIASSRSDINSSDAKGHSGGEPVNRGIVGGHAYTVLGVRKINGQPYIALRNPWGRTTAEIDVNELTGEETMNSNRLEGTQFLLSLEDFITYFRKYSVVDITQSKKKKGGK